MKSSEEKATFAGGCFWGVEKVFSEVPGVLSTRVGYTGGTKKDPTYREVCTGLTGHAEAIEITYDPSKTGYPELLEIFFSVHDPTTLNRQGPDIGTQYRSAIFAHSSGQMAAASKAKALLDGSGIFKSKLVTQIAPATEFYPAEDTHQQYLKKNPHGYCSIQFQSKKIQEVLSVGLKN
ncbi:MAG: peptide-methionine (S)-S-oxide reductase MsrA [Candidatus Omnitrophica bacterium]|nr:peptide-methionine (S)-S-oxide reductase MsrA [Candidatus Omnitrophota bacterium]